ncbi:hypothetical protein SAMN05192549_109213 [Duganella sacchari]|uniref:Uncharacterized protein n=1 Tax=Duganella sacchari TaxID=551987 RepID=A0A1M7R2F3_9BURK|nr:hypothetical protein [Duganella sacchari]SHN38908.1 hypothetical protein SAMN05192549_109213 [Duganella sacchari]
MKSIFIRTASLASRKAYAVQRMNAAAQRMLHADTIAEEIKAGHWILAWAVAAGARPSSRAAPGSLVPFAVLNLH